MKLIPCSAQEMNLAKSRELWQGFALLKGALLRHLAATAPQMLQIRAVHLLRLLVLAYSSGMVGLATCSDAPC